MQGFAIIGVGSLGMYNEIMFIINCILDVVSHFDKIFYNDDAAAVRVGSADLFIFCIIRLLLKCVIFYCSLFKFGKAPRLSYLFLAQDHQRH